MTRPHPESARPSARSEDGSTLLVVLAMSGILSLLVVASFALARQAIGVADAEEEVHAALAAAEAGLDDYLFRLNSNDAYWRFGPGNPPPGGNPAFDDFVPIPGGPSAGEFTYTVDTSSLATERTLEVTSTGRAEGRARTISAVLKQNSFLDYVYFTDLETLSPAAYATPADQTWAADNCATRRWVTERPITGLPSNPSAGCTEIFWVTDDVVKGPFHTNDRFRLAGNARWEGPATGSDPVVPRYDANGQTPSFAVEGDPAFQRPLQLPPSNSALRIAAIDDGCVFTGPTSVVLLDTGDVQVTSPYTKESGVGCGSWTSGVDAPQVIDIPANGVIYVQAVPASTSDANHSPAGCPAGNGNGLGYPWNDDIWPYSCRDGDAFVEGTLDGRLTVGAEHDVIITWHLDYAGTDDMLGLIANEFVAIYHPVTCVVPLDSSGGCSRYGNANAGPVPPGVPSRDAPFRDPRIDAAVLSVTDSFLLQTWNRGRSADGSCDVLGTITLNGAIAQTYRGPVGTFTSGTGVPCTGYAKDYRYDTRLQFSNPPSFIDPVGASWRSVRVAEQFPAVGAG
jgi:hypothetical protein